MTDKFDEETMRIAREEASQCWCDTGNESKVLDPVLAESFAKRLAKWITVARAMSAAEAQTKDELDWLVALFLERYVEPDIVRPGLRKGASL